MTPWRALGAAALLAAGLSSGGARGAEFVTDDPVAAFVHGQYPLGDDYFIGGNGDTHIFRCLLTATRGPFDGIALSEISIWGNRSGPWDLFRKTRDGRFAYVETKPLADTSCLERCATRDYLASGRCRWQRGWPAR